MTARSGSANHNQHQPPAGQGSSGFTLMSNRRLGSQLTFLVAIGLFGMVLSVSIGTSIIINQSLTNNFVQNGRNIAGVLAEQAALPVLLGNPEGARQAIDVVRTFPSVTQVAIYELDGNMLAQSGDTITWHSVNVNGDSDNATSAGIKIRADESAQLEFEGQKYWQFSSPVLSDNPEPELADPEANRVQQTGFVRVLISKDQLYSARNNIIIGNIIVLFGVAVLLLLALRSLSGTLTRPLEDFVATMTAGARGKRSNLRVDLSGSKETQQLSNAFNQMMQVLEDRELQLATARDHALAAAKLKSEFAANVSHEIRTPLNGILGTLNLLSDTGLAKEQQELIALAESSSEALMILINDILDFSRMSLDQSTLTNTEFDLFQLLEELMFLHAQSADARDLDVLTSYDSDLPFVVESDPNKLRQLLNNLINNAVKFTDLGSVMISARKETDAVGKLWIRLSVRDTGIGISERDLHTIFLPYSQSDGSMSRKYSGTGLGLAICDKLAELLRGDIGVHSELGVGSEFYVRIPFAYRADIKTGAGLNHSSAFKGRRVLAYGSNAEVRGACESLCELHQLNAETFESVADLEQQLMLPGDASELPILMFYFSRQENVRHRWQQVQDLLARVDCKAIVITGSSEADIDALRNQTAQRLALVRSPLRAHVFATTLANLLQIDLPDSGSTESPFDYSGVDGSRVLLVEDNIVNQRVAKTMLEKLGCDVMVAENGVEALACTQQQRFDLIYMDCQMPRMNGYDASREIRKLEDERSRIPIIAMTANVGQQDRAHCFDAGMNDFLSKPVNLEELAVVTRKWIMATHDQQSAERSV